MRSLRRLSDSLRKRLWVAAAAGLVTGGLSACDRPPAHPALKTAGLSRLVPAHEFVFRNTQYSGFSFSPDGTRLAWQGPSGWRSALHVRSEVDGKTHVYRIGGSGRHWTADGRRLLILDDKSGAENHRLYRLDVEDPDATLVDLTPFEGARVWLHQIVKSDPDHVLVLHNRRKRVVRDLYRINLTTGAEEVVALNPGGGAAPITDIHGKFLGWRRAAMPERARGQPLPPHLRERSSLRETSRDLTQPVGFSGDRTQAWVLSNRGRDRVALFHVDAARGGLATLVHEDPSVDVSQVVMSAVEGKPLLALSNPSYPRTEVFDQQLAARLRPLLDAYAGTRIGFTIETMAPDEQRLVAMVYTHAGRRYYLVDRNKGRDVLLGDSRPADFRAAMAVPEAVEFSARDGLRVPAYLLRPSGATGTRLPLVLLVHGGPWSRVSWGDADHSEDLLRAQFLANRGYAVLLINFRGSTGYGREFMTAAVGQFGAAMQDDLMDGVQWAIDAGVADPSKIAIMGHSYGGYATLMALAQQPTKFACGVAVAGPVDLPRLIETFPSYWELDLLYWYSYVGDPAVSTDKERMQGISPVNLAHLFERPVLILQGATDVRVPAEQSRAMVARLREHAKAVEYQELPDMGHSTGYWAHHLRILRRTETFLAQCLGGRAARFDALEWAARLSGRLPLW
jgi:dipeptidyl aminopeptidase/acylaminoacyl peptidase